MDFRVITLVADAISRRKRNFFVTVQPV